MAKEVYMCNALTGGASGALDRIPTVDLDGDSRAIVITATDVYHYYLDPTSAAAESSPGVIKPDDETGDQRWILTGTTKLTLPANDHYTCTSLIGGAVGALDKIDGAALDGNSRAIVMTGGYLYSYYLNPTSGAAESSPDVIMPDTNAGVKRWILMGVVHSSAIFSGNVDIAGDLEVVKIDNVSNEKFAGFLSNNRSVGIGIGNNNVMVIGTDPNISLKIDAKGTGNIILNTIDGKNVGIGSGSGPTANDGKVLFFGDNVANPTMGGNTAGVYAKDVAGTVEMYAVDEAGTVTQLTAHPSDILDVLPALDTRKTAPHGLFVSNEFIGEETYIDLALLAEEVEVLTGKKIIHKISIPQKDWDIEQQIRLDARDSEIAAQVQRKADADKAISDWKSSDKSKKQPDQFAETLLTPYVKKAPPLWMQKRGVKSDL